MQETQKEIKRIVRSFEATFNGTAWSGVSLCSALEYVNAQDAFRKRPPLSHSIAEIVQHLVNWRNFAIAKLEGYEAFDIVLNSPEDWPVLNEGNEQLWKKILDDLHHSQKMLLKTLEHLQDEKLSEKIPGKNYNFYVLLHGIIQHDQYHTGQISLVKKFT